MNSFELPAALQHQQLLQQQIQVSQQHSALVVLYLSQIFRYGTRE